MKTLVAFRPKFGGSPRVHSKQVATDRPRRYTYAIIAIIAFVAGLWLGQAQSNEAAQRGSRIAWPTKAEIFR
jgi:hypothetical protein